MCMCMCMSVDAADVDVDVDVDVDMCRPIIYSSSSCHVVKGVFLFFFLLFSFFVTYVGQIERGMYVCR